MRAQRFDLLKEPEREIDESKAETGGMLSAVRMATTAIERKYELH